MNTIEATIVVDQIFELYEKFGQADYIGEPVSQIEHMCQSAQLAEAAGYDDELIIAAFFHDLGHLLEHVMPVEQMDGVGVMDHETIGKAYLIERGFSERVGNLVAGHVNAKRYLTYKYPDYFNQLSDASKKTLELQGGVMSEEEALNFENDVLFEDYIRMRNIDDKAKVTNIPLPSLERYKEIAVRLLVKLIR
ncbi:MAG: HD domain-containing protein [Chitinophagaceae bacterium]